MYIYSVLLEAEMAFLYFLQHSCVFARQGKIGGLKTFLAGGCIVSGVEAAAAFQKMLVKGYCNKKYLNVQNLFMSFEPVVYQVSWYFSQMWLGREFSRIVKYFLITLTLENVMDINDYRCM